MQSDLGLEAYVYPVDPTPQHSDPEPQEQWRGGAGAGAQAEQEQGTPAEPPITGPIMSQVIPGAAPPGRIALRYQGREAAAAAELTREVEALSLLPSGLRINAGDERTGYTVPDQRGDRKKNKKKRGGVDCGGVCAGVAGPTQHPEAWLPKARLPGQQGLERALRPLINLLAPEPCPQPFPRPFLVPRLLPAL